MDKAMTIDLGDYFAAFVERQVAEGRYASPSEVLRAGLRLLERDEAKLAALREAKLDALRAALIAGEESGPPQPFDLEEFLDEMHREHEASHRATAK